MASITNVQVGVCEVTINGTNLGHTKGSVEFTYEPEYFEATVDKYGNTPVNSYLIGQSVTLKVPLAEFTIANLGVAMVGQFAGAGNTRRQFGSNAGVKGTDNAYEVVAHPINEGTRRHDIVLYKAYVSEAFTLTHAVDEEKIIEVTFKALVDETKSNNNYLGMIGDSTT